MSRKVLLIEDNEQNRYLATFLLHQKGYIVVPASDGMLGIELAQTCRPDIILLDVHLPLLDGYAVARALRAIDSLRGIPIIAVTSYAMAGDREKSIAAGCNGYIEKPINPETFVAEIELYSQSSPSSPSQP